MNGQAAAGGRGTFYAPASWGISTADSGANWAGALQGWASPIGGLSTVGGGTRLEDVVIDFSIKFIDATAADRFAWIALCQGDLNISVDGAAGTAGSWGYFAVLRKNGTLAIYKIVGDGATSPVALGSIAGTAIADGDTATYRLAVTALDLKIERLDVPTELTVADINYRGAFLYLGVKGASAQFSNVTIAA